MNRRAFLKRSAGAAVGAAGVPHVVASSAPGGGDRAAASERITVGCIGVGSRGLAVMRSFLSHGDAQVVAVCDVWACRRSAGRQWVQRQYGGRGCATYTDFRDLLARDDVDAVLIATPDHWHVPIALAAARAGKDIYLEKPIGVTLAEAGALRAAVGRYGTVFQFGTQQRSDAKFRRACELVRNGRIGRLHTVNVWSPASRSGGSLRPAPVPAGLDYDMWLGPAPFAPHTEHRCTNGFRPGDPGKIWPFISDYCVGWVAGWGIHPLDIALWGGGTALTGPLEIRGTGTFPADGACDTATGWRITARYAGGIRLNFTGQPPPAQWRDRYGGTEAHGTAFEGTEGWVHVDRSRIHARPRTLLGSAIRPGEVHLYRSPSHVRNFLDCVRSRSPTVCDMASAVAVDTLCHLSAIALRVQRPLQWDPANERFLGNDAANRMLSRALRSPWHL